MAVLTAVVFGVGVLGTLLLGSGSAQATDVSVGAILVLVSALIAVTTGWGLVAGYALMIAGAVIGFVTMHSEVPR